jgi:hypothetical protein
MNNELMKTLIAIGIAMFCAASAQAEVYVKPNARCFLNSGGRFPTTTIVYNGPAYQEVRITEEAHMSEGGNMYVSFMIAGRSEQYSTTTDCLIETDGSEKNAQ